MSSEAGDLAWDAAELDEPYELDDADVRRYREKGHVTLPGLLSTELLEAIAPALSALVEALNQNTKPMAERSSYQQSFIQVPNLWRRSESVRRFVMGKRCARVAAELLGVSGVRMYHDQALYKEAGGGITAWHCDQFFWPMNTDRSITAWIPLQDTPLEMGPVSFADGSQLADYGRNLGISDKGEVEIGAAIEAARLVHEPRPYRLGDVSFHGGWTMHRAEPNRTDRERRAMTMIYMDEDMRLAPPANPFQEIDARVWCAGVAEGEVIAGELNPVVYSQRR